MTTQPQYEIEERGATEATVRVTVGPEAFREQLDAVYRRYAREARIPGFRKGHIPRNVLESRFGKEAFVAETQEDLERQHLPEALMTLKLRPVSRPRVEVVSFGESDPFVFTASFAVLP
ncbi:MAG: trigger factor family protein, partial [Candidatus Bipolaricaulia bacterium]